MPIQRGLAERLKSVATTNGCRRDGLRRLAIAWKEQNSSRQYQNHTGIHPALVLQTRASDREHCRRGCGRHSVHRMWTNGKISCWRVSWCCGRRKVLIANLCTVVVCVPAFLHFTFVSDRFNFLLAWDLYCWLFVLMEGRVT